MSTNSKIEEHPPFSLPQLDELAKILADCFFKEKLLELMGKSFIPTDGPRGKEKLLSAGFKCIQEKTKMSNNILKFIKDVMDIGGYVNQKALFEERQHKINQILLPSGFELLDTGRIRKVKRAETLSEIQQRTRRFKDELERRNLHNDVIAYASNEIIEKNYFHAVFESMKSISSKIRKLVESDSDGATLVDFAFGCGGKSPRLLINKHQTETEKNEQKGFMSLLKGMYSMIRNPLSHEAKIEWEMPEEDALDILSTISMIHRKLDRVKIQIN